MGRIDPYEALRQRRREQRERALEKPEEQVKLTVKLPIELAADLRALAVRKRLARDQVIAALLGELLYRHPELVDSVLAKVLEK
ncbi:MAG: hypothetical protein NZ482_01940 [Gloeomargarita sp. SKYG98]|nr:hypothetical protein [Gloeomargarita sp. SKYG98]